MDFANFSIVNLLVVTAIIVIHTGGVQSIEVPTGVLNIARTRILYATMLDETKDKLVVTYYAHEDCTTCKPFEKKVEAIAKNFTNVTFVKYAVIPSPWPNLNLKTPSLFFEKQDKLLGIYSGGNIEEMEKKIEEVVQEHGKD